MFGNLIEYLYIVPAALIAIMLHEIAHGLVSYWLGDPTPKRQGRLSLNPLKHLDPVGTICLILFHVGWAKPVVVNPDYYKKRKLGMALVALAGPLTNFIVAIVSWCVQECSVMCDSLGPPGLWPTMLLCPCNSSCKNTGVDSRFFSRGSS